MKMISKEKIHGKTVITISKKILFWTVTKQFEAQLEFPTGYWEWLELPNRTRVHDALSFQLDAWNRIEV